MSIMKFGPLTIALGALLLIAPSAGHARGLPHRSQIGFFIQRDSRLTGPVSSIYVASLVGRQPAVPVKPLARSRFTTFLDSLFGRRDNASRPRATANFVRKTKPESKGHKLEEMEVVQPTVAPDDKAVSLMTPAATSTAVSPQSPPIAPISTPNPGVSNPGVPRINDLPTLPLE